MKGSRVGIKGQETPEHSSRDPDAVLCSAMVVLDSPLQRQSANRPPVPAEEECGLLSAAHLLKPLPLRRRSGLQMPLTWTPGGAFAQTLQRKVPRKKSSRQKQQHGSGTTDSHPLPRSNCETTCSSNAWRTGDRKLFHSRMAQAQLLLPQEQVM